LASDPAASSAPPGATAAGLSGVRDWIVLSALIAETGRTQLGLGHALGLDKTTLTALLDRVEQTD
jgi:hypothetical protein